MELRYSKFEMILFTGISFLSVVTNQVGVCGKTFATLLAFVLVYCT